jgi:hypothetical protein
VSTTTVVFRFSQLARTFCTSEPHSFLPSFLHSQPTTHSVTAAVSARGFTLGDALGAFAFLHIHTHAPQIVQSLFPTRLELVRVLALLPLSSGATALSPSKAQRVGGGGGAGGGPDSSVLRLLWATGQRKGCVRCVVAAVWCGAVAASDPPRNLSILGAHIPP